MAKRLKGDDLADQRTHPDLVGCNPEATDVRKPANDWHRFRRQDVVSLLRGNTSEHPGPG
ncbi:MAG: hypothetical protein AAF989_14910 [Planctomycetota bacterium]